MLNQRQLVNNFKHQSIFAFTLIELLLVLAIMAVLTSIGTITLSNLIPKANLFTTSDILLAEIRHQQLRAMNHEKNSDELASDYGIYLQENQYTLFSGNVYNADDPNNLVTEIESSLQLNTTFPDQVIVFAQGSGEIIDFIENQNTINLVDINFGQTESLTFNFYGVPQ